MTISGVWALSHLYCSPEGAELTRRSGTPLSVRRAVASWAPAAAKGVASAPLSSLMERMEPTLPSPFPPGTVLLSGS